MTEENKKNTEKTSNDLGKPDPETLHTPDPQKNMEGPVSSLMQETGEAFNTSETEEEAKEEKEERM